MEYKFFNDYVLEYLSSKEDQLSKMSYHHYSLLIHKHIIPYFEHIEVEDLNQVLMVNFLNSLKMEDSSKNVIKSIMKSILESMNVSDVFLLSVFVQNTVNKEKCVLSKEKEEKLRNYCISNIDSYTLSILLALEGGLKIAEICALKVEDLKDGKIHVHSQVQRIPNANNKTKKTEVAIFELEDMSNRIIPIPEYLYELLVQFNQKDNTYLLTKSIENKAARIYQINVKKIIQKVGFEFNYNSLRETFKVNCIESNMNVYTLMEILGVNSLSFLYKDRNRL